MAWLTVAEVNTKINQLARAPLARWPVSKINPECFLLGNSTRNVSGTGAAGAYVKMSSYEINALKIPSRVTGKMYEGGLDHLSVLIVGGVLGNELIGPDASLHFAELFLNAVAGYQKVDSAQKTTTYIPAQDIEIQIKGQAKKYKIDHTDLEEILETINIWVVPLLNPGGRDQSLSAFGGPFEGRPNPEGVCLNRNFDIAWDFKKLFNQNPGWSTFLNSMDPNRDDPKDCKMFYQGSSAESEKETKALVGLLCKNPPNPPGDPSITWLFDIHGQNGAAQKVSYPWSWAEIQTNTANMCVKNAAYDPPHKPGRDGYVALGAQNYGEYLPASTETQLKQLGTAFTDGARACGGVLWDPPGQGSKIYPCVGALDDYFLWLDRNHCRAFTVECGGLQPDDKPVGQPPHSERDDELDQVAAGLFNAIKQIKDWVKASGNPEQDLSRLSTNQLSCP